MPVETIFPMEMNNKNSFDLVSYMASPGFKFDDFKLLKKNDLVAMYPQHKAIVQRLIGFVRLFCF